MLWSDLGIVAGFTGIDLGLVPVKAADETGHIRTCSCASRFTAPDIRM